MLKKSLGQNFLIDPNIARKVINTIEFNNKVNLIEIGPGKGFLTDYLIKQKINKITLIEKDKNLFLELKKKYNKNKKIIIHNQDALKTTLINKINKPKIIVSNLPYNISVKLIVGFLDNIEDFEGLYFMIQKEVANKFKYNNTSKYNRLNLLCQLTSDYKIHFNISPNVFIPKPKIESSFVSFKKNVKVKINMKSFKNFSSNIFSSKRKILINNLIKNNQYKKIIDNNKLNIDLRKRTEDLKFDEIIKLYKILH